MKKNLVLAVILLGLFLPFPVKAQLVYFGYVGGADDDVSLAKTKGFTNFAQIATSADVTDQFVTNRVTAMSQKGLKAVIDLGTVLWCDYDGTGRYNQICEDWRQRWVSWKQNHAGILTPDKVLAFTILDEPFARGADMASYDDAALQVKSDMPWVHVALIEASCVAQGTCSYVTTDPALGYRTLVNYHGSLPNVDWVGLDAYGIHPATDSAFLNARSYFKGKFPSKKWVYVMDGYYDPNLQGRSWSLSYMGQIAHEWYDVAQADSDTVLLGVFLWPAVQGWTTSKDFTCDVLPQHVAIGRAITGKVRTQSALPVGSLDFISGGGVVEGYACDPDGALCELPHIALYYNGSSPTTPYYTGAEVWDPRCSTGYSSRFRQYLSNNRSGNTITAYASDLDAGGTSLPCSVNGPGCIWYSNLQPAKGYMDGISQTGTATGWACDPDAPQLANSVRLTLVNGTQIGIYTTNLSNEQAVTDECGGGTLHRFSVQLPAWTYGQQIYAYSEDFVSGEYQIPWLCPWGWSCSW